MNENVQAPEDLNHEDTARLIVDFMHRIIKHHAMSITDETPTTFVFQMNDCRVQSARKRKGLDDYPCKSGGMAEYPTFAEAIDPLIKTECIGCPPDAHPEEWYCAWRFSLA